MLRLRVQKVGLRFSRAKLSGVHPLREDGVKEETLRSASHAAAPSRAAGHVGKELQTEVALPESPLPAMQFKCTISVDINNLEGS